MSNGISACPYVWWQDGLFQVNAFDEPYNGFVLAQRDFIQLDTFQQFGICGEKKKRTSYMWDLTIGGHNRLVMIEIKKQEKRKKEELALLTALLELEGELT